ncbi:MAG: transcription-repair coupling factor, partial [Natronospirillum sp.]
MTSNAMNLPFALAVTPTDALPHQPGDRRVWGQLPAGADAWALADIIARHAGQVIVLGSNASDLDRLQREYRVFAEPEGPPRWLPDWEILPYDNFSPHQDIISDRISTLYELSQSAATTKRVRTPVFAALSTVMHRFMPVDYVAQWTIRLAVGDQLNPDLFRQRLHNAGYQHASTVTEHGEFTLRGGLIDIFPMGADAPLRLELFDDEIESIRIFDPESQRTRRPVERFELLPGREFPLTDEGVARFREAFRADFDVDPRRCPMYQDITSGLTPAGIEYYLDLFFDQLASFFDYLPSDTLLVTQGDLNAEIEHFIKDVHERYENRRHDISRPILTPERIYLRPEELNKRLNDFPRLHLSPASAAQTEGANKGAIDCEFGTPNAWPIDHRATKPLQAITQMLAETQRRVLFCADTQGRRESLLDLLNDEGIRPTTFGSVADFINSESALGITVAPLATGWVRPARV